MLLIIIWSRSAHVPYIWNRGVDINDDYYDVAATLRCCHARLHIHNFICAAMNTASTVMTCKVLFRAISLSFFSPLWKSVLHLGNSNRINRQREYRRNSKRLDFFSKSHKRIEGERQRGSIFSYTHVLQIMNLCV